MHALTSAALLGVAARLVNAQTDTSGAFSVPGFSVDPLPTGLQLATAGSGTGISVGGSLQPTSDLLSPQITSDPALLFPTDTNNPFPTDPGTGDGSTPVDSLNSPSVSLAVTPSNIVPIMESAPADTVLSLVGGSQTENLITTTTTPVALPAETAAPTLSISTVTQQFTVTVTPTPTGAITLTPSSSASPTTAGFLSPKPTSNAWGYYRTSRDIKGSEHCVGANIQIDSAANFNLTATKAYNITNGNLGKYVWVMSFKESNGKKRDIYLGTQSGPGQASYLYFTCPTPKPTTTATSTPTPTSIASGEVSTSVPAAATTAALFRRQAPTDTSTLAPFTLDPSLTFPLPTEIPASTPATTDPTLQPPPVGGLDGAQISSGGSVGAVTPSDSVLAIPSNPLEPPGAEVSAIADPGVTPLAEQTQSPATIPIALPNGTQAAEPLLAITSSEITDTTPPATATTSESTPPAATTTESTPTSTSTPTPTPISAPAPAKDIPACNVAGSDVMLNGVVTSSKDDAVEVFDTIISNKPWGFAKTAFTGKNAYNDATDDGDCLDMSEGTRPNFKNLRYTAIGYYIPSLNANAAARQALWVQDGGRKILKLSLGNMNSTDDHISTRFFNRTGYYLFQGGQCQWVDSCGYDCFFSIYDRPYLQQMGSGKQAGIPGISESKANGRWVNLYLGNPTMEKVAVSYPGLVAFDKSQKWLTTQAVFSFASAGGSDDVTLMHFDRVKKDTPKATEFSLPKECVGAEKFIKKT